MKSLNLQAPGAVAGNWYDLHSILLVVCLLTFAGVFGALLYSIVMHRKSKVPGGQGPVNFHASTTVEVVWTVVPILIIIGMAIPATKAVMSLKAASDPDMTVRVTAYQGRWGFDYLQGAGAGVHLNKDDTAAQPGNVAALVVPANAKVRLVFAAVDSVPDTSIPPFGASKEAPPGLLRDAWFEESEAGVYRGFCEQPCGPDHATVPVVVNVLSAPDFAGWVAGQR